MTRKTSPDTPFPFLLRSRRRATLWTLRILLRCGTSDDLFTHPRFGLLRTALRLPLLGAADDMASTWRRLEATLDRLELMSGALRLPGALQANLDLMRREFGFDGVETAILALTVLLRTDEALFQAADASQPCVNMPGALSKVLGIPAPRIARRLEPGSRLRRSNIIAAYSGGDISEALCLRRGGLRRLGSRRLRGGDELLQGMLCSAPGPSLGPEDYAHLEHGFETLADFLLDALKYRRKGVNVLLYGPPGTGKSELVRTLAAHLQVPLFDVASMDEHGNALDPKGRLDGAVTGLFLLGQRRALVCFDEVEGIFNDGSWLFGKPSTAESQKLFFTQLLENNRVPVFWVANSVRGVDPAFARRFELVVHLESPPRGRRLKLLERECRDLVSREQLRRLSQFDQITPAMVTRASSVVRRMRPLGEEAAERLLEAVLDGVLEVQGHPPLRTALPGAPGFDPAMCNAGINLDELGDALSRSGAARLCLYGPPGTGKTAFGHWLGERLDRPLIRKRVSDLQSKWLGEMERNLAKAFEQARRDSAILQIDELDSFLQDRRRAERSWEVSQVNEFLTQLENFEGLFIASTNLMDNLDPAVLRRFDFKIRMDYLDPQQVMALLARQLSAFGFEDSSYVGESWARLSKQKLVPGDFAVISRRHRVVPFTDEDAVVEALCAEASLRALPVRRIGFV